MARYFSYQSIRSSLVIVPLLLLIACSKSDNSGGGSVIILPPPTTILPFFNVPAGWKYSSTLSSAYPAGMQVYTIDSLWDDKKIKAVVVAWDTKADKVELKPVLSANAQKPSSFYTAESGVTLACMNSGYFGGNQSYSTVKYNNSVYAPNIKAVNRMYNGLSTPYHPTRSAIGISNTGVPGAAWIYHEGTNNETIYSYPAPSPNEEGQQPQAIPGATFPQGASAWNVTTAIGGSPMLMYNGEIKITDKQELISVNNTTARPRSAIGFNANGIMLLMAVEGDNISAGYNGLNLLQLATVLKSFGLTNAINLDGGGSTSLVINNQLTVRPGDNGIERPVVSAILLKRK